jgi:hypothetical protein
MEYFNGKAKHGATIEKEKIRLWNGYCNMTTSNNPWNEVYKLAAGKRNTSTQITTLRKPDGSMTADAKETLQLMLDHFTPEDNEYDDNDYHKHVRAETQQSANTADDREFTIEEIRKAVKSMDNKRATGEGGITGEIYKRTFEIFPKYITAMYNGCLRFGIFPEVEESKTDSNYKTRKRKQLRSTEISPNKPNKCRWQNTAESIDKRNQPQHLHKGIYEQQPIWLYSTNEHNRRG